MDLLLTLFTNPFTCNEDSFWGHIAAKCKHLRYSFELSAAYMYIGSVGTILTAQIVKQF